MTTIPKPSTTSDDGPWEYDVLWSGVNDGHDGDLLNPLAVIDTKRAAPPLRSGPPDAADLVYAALPARDQSGLSITELALKTGLPKSTVNGALYRLRHRGRLISKPMPATARDFTGRTPQWYWQRSEDRPTASTASTNEGIVSRQVLDWLARG